MSNVVKNRSFAADFANIRIEKFHFSQEKMAEWLGVSYAEVKNIERGVIPSTKIFLLVCNKFGLHPMDYLHEALTTDNSKKRYGKKRYRKETTV